MLSEQTISILAYLNDSHQRELKEFSKRLKSQNSNYIEEMLNKSDNGRYVSMEESCSHWLSNNKNTEHYKRIDLYRGIRERYASRDIDLLTYWDTEYPMQLRELSDAPLVLYRKGESFDNRPKCAIVGTRQPSEKGLEIAYNFGKELAEKGVTVVSGLAYGIDYQAHRGALDGKGKTIAVLATDVDHIYPREHLHLSEEIEKNGMLLSESSNIGKIHRGKFIERNRIISGVSQLVVVIEAREEGGSIHQARKALAQQRPLFVVDHDNFESNQSLGGFHFLKELGATAIKNPDDVILRLRKQTTQTKLA